MNGFLTTNGEFHTCNHWEHLDLAQELVENMNVFVKNRLEAEDYLQSLGWIVVRSRDVYGKIGCRNKDGVRIHLTDEQKAWLVGHYEEMTNSCRESVDQIFRDDR